MNKSLIKIGTNAAVVLLVLSVVLYAKSTFDIFTTTPEVNSSSLLTKIKELSSLSTLEVYYSGVADVHNDKDKIVYHIYYNATLRYGIDFEEIEIDVDNENHQFTVHMPNAKYLSNTIDKQTIDYLYIDNSYNKSGLTGVNLTHCEVDLMNELGNLSYNYCDYANENAKNAIQAITTPFLKQNGIEYSLVFS